MFCLDRLIMADICIDQMTHISPTWPRRRDHVGVCVKNAQKKLQDFRKFEQN